MYPAPIEALIKAFRKLPSVGPRTAERYVFTLLKSGKKDAAELANALKQLIEQIQSCQRCLDFADDEFCPICIDPSRDAQIICVVAEPQEKHVIESTGSYSGLYHVLRGKIMGNSIDDAKYLKIPELLRRLQKEPIKEIILALSPDMAGETTMMYLEKKIREVKADLKISRLARGLPMGSDLQYADDITLESALKYRH